MEGLLDLLAKYWIVPVVVVVIGGPAVFSLIKQKAGSLRLSKLPSLNFKKAVVPTAVDAVDLVDKDIEAIQWLANRAVDVNDEQLILELENVNKKFFHIHRNMRKSVVGPVSAE